VSEDPSPQLRISDVDREAALQALGEHMSVGRIDLDEYGDRSAKVTAAKTRGELSEVFTDLPQPHPQLGAAPSTPAAAEVQPAAAPGHPSWGERPLNQRLTATIVPVVWLAAIALVSVGAGWWWIIAPILLTSFGRQLWGHGWNHDNDHRERRLDILDSQRERREDMRDRRDSRRDYRGDRRDRRRY
jgi:hypothetical protein